MDVRLRLACLVIGLLASAAPAADKRPIQVQDLFKFKRVAAPRISPDGKAVVYQITSVSLEENKSTTALWVASTDGKSPPKQLTDPKGKKDSSPQWSPDGKTILFESTRSDPPQLYVIPAEGGEPKQITSISTGAGDAIWSPDGKYIAFVSAVFPEFSEKPFAESDKLNKEKDDAIDKSPVKAKVFTRLFYRHWVEYVEDKRQHLFVIAVNPLWGYAEPHDATPGDRDAFPTSTTFSSGDDFTFTPDSKHLVFTAVPAKNEAWSTNYDICRVSITNTSPKWECLTTANKAADSGPKFSPDGKKLAWRAQKQAGYEADKWDINVANCKADGTFAAEAKPLLGRDQRYSVNEFIWSMLFEREATGTRLGFLFTADSAGSQPIFAYVLGGDMWGPREAGAVAALSSSADGRRFTYNKAYMTAPAEVFADSWDAQKNAGEVAITHANDAMPDLDLRKPESVTVPVEGADMQMWVLKPPGFDPAKKWPVVYLVHGGPQGAWEDGWSFRWNPQLWAAQG